MILYKHSTFQIPIHCRDNLVHVEQDLGNRCSNIQALREYTFGSMAMEECQYEKRFGWS
jgi:hypothetical protein